MIYVNKVLKLPATLKLEERDFGRTCIDSFMWERKREAWFTAKRWRERESIRHACMLTALIQLTSRSFDQEASIVTPRFMFRRAVM